MSRFALLALLLSGAAPAQTAPSVPPRYCDAKGLDDLVGTPATSEIGTQALRRSHAGTMRWIRPGAMVTMDFRNDRLNITTDKRNVVTGFKCG